MLIVVTGVIVDGACLLDRLHVARRDTSIPRFIVLPQSLFTFFMLMLVTVGQPGAAVLRLGGRRSRLSYLLIGFWYDRPSAPTRAAIKAFIVNRIGDFGFMLGLALIFAVWMLSRQRSTMPT